MLSVLSWQPVAIQTELHDFCVVNGKIESLIHDRKKHNKGSVSDLFICYSRTDIAIAKQLTECFEAEGWTVYLDVHTQVGTRWHQVIERELHAAKAVVALWSARSRDAILYWKKPTMAGVTISCFPLLSNRWSFLMALAAFKRLI